MRIGRGDGVLDVDDGDYGTGLLRTGEAVPV